MNVFLVYWTFYQPNVTTGGAVIGVKEITKCEVFKNETKRDKFIADLNESATKIGVSINITQVAKEI